MKKAKVIILCFGLVGLTLLSSRYYFKVKMLRETFSSPELYPKMNRGKYVLNSYNGDAEATMYLARYYGSIGIYEAQLFWLKKAYAMGDKRASKELIEACESAIVNQWR